MFVTLRRLDEQIKRTDDRESVIGACGKIHCVFRKRLAKLLCVFQINIMVQIKLNCKSLTALLEYQLEV